MEASLRPWMFFLTCTRYQSSLNAKLSNFFDPDSVNTIQTETLYDSTIQKKFAIFNQTYELFSTVKFFLMNQKSLKSWIRSRNRSFRNSKHCPALWQGSAAPEGCWSARRPGSGGPGSAAPGSPRRPEWNRSRRARPPVPHGWQTRTRDGSGASGPSGRRRGDRKQSRPRPQADPSIRHPYDLSGRKIPSFKRHNFFRSERRRVQALGHERFDEKQGLLGGSG